MALKRIRLGDYIEKSTINNKKLIYNEKYILGVTNEGTFSKPRGSLYNIDLQPYKIVKNGAFVYNPSRLNIGSIAFFEDELCIVSHLYMVFYLNDEGKKEINPKWLYIYLRRKEFQREVTFRNFGSQRPEFNFNDISEIFIPLPDLPTQEKFVNVYLSMLKNQKSYERGLEDLKLVCDGYIENLRRKMPCEPIGPYLAVRSEQNSKLKYKDNNVLGVSQEKQIISTKSDTKSNDLSKFIVVYPDDFIYNPRNGIAVGLNRINAIISWNNTAFYIMDTNKIIPEYLMMWLSRKEWNRKVKVDSWGSSTEVYSFESLSSTMIPLPKYDVQKSIVDIFKCYRKRKEINEKLKQQIKDICSILIKGSIDEAKRGV